MNQRRRKQSTEELKREAARIQAEAKVIDARTERVKAWGRWVLAVLGVAWTALAWLRK